MRKLISFILITGTIILAASCDYDDSDDIDFITPNDSTTAGIDIKEVPK